MSNFSGNEKDCGNDAKPDQEDCIDGSGSRAVINNAHERPAKSDQAKDENGNKKGLLLRQAKCFFHPGSILS